mmetsp:Transcript_21524/g.32046  ORF Transcript_21524/g.32046 Transcript_21524/m.32046 type:complete len:82 (+) Transcript_21524:172-417(+)
MRRPTITLREQSSSPSSSRIGLNHPDIHPMTDETLITSSYSYNPHDFSSILDIHIVTGKKKRSYLQPIAYLLHQLTQKQAC